MNWGERADAIIERGFLPSDESHERHLALVNERIEQEGMRGLVWAAMRYQCDACGVSEWYELEVGVEGPERWKADSTYLPCAFGAGRCRLCGGSMMHVDFAGDQHFAARRAGVGLPAASHVFRVPSEPTRHLTHLDENGVPQYQVSTQAHLQWILRTPL